MPWSGMTQASGPGIMLDPSSNNPNVETYNFFIFYKKNIFKLSLKYSKQKFKFKNYL